MGNQILFTYDKKYSEEPYYPPQNWDESDINVLIMEEPSSSKRELEQLFLEAQEYDFLMGKTPQVLLDSWEEQE